MLAGVSGGLARYFEIHPAVFRVGFVVLTLLGGAGILIYAAAALVMPDEGKEDSIATAALRNRRDRPWPLIGLGLLAVGGRRPALAGHPVADGDAWLLFLIAGALILWITRQRPLRRRRDDPRPAPTADRRRCSQPQDSRRVRRVLGSDRRSCSPRSSRSCSSPSAVFAAVFDVHLGRGIGDRTYAVTSVAGAATATTGSASARSSSTSASCSCPPARRTSTRASTSATSR